MPGSQRTRLPLSMAFSVLVLRSFLESVERLGLSRDDLLAGILAEAALAQDGLWIQDSQFGAIVDRALLLSADPALGLRVGERSAFTAFDAAGLLFSVVPTFKEAVAAMARFHSVARDQPDVFLEEDASALTVTYRSLDASATARRCVAEIVLASVSGLLRQFGGPGGVPVRVEFDYPAPVHAAEYSKVFGCEAYFERPRIAMVVSVAVAQRQQLLSQPEIASELRKRAEVRLLKGPYPRSMAGRVRYHLRESWSTGPPSMDGVAQQLGMSQRSLHRYLAREGVDYRSILNEARCEVAGHLLREPGSSVKQVSHALGFASSSAFYRAFKRWMGCSPSDYAAQQGSSANGQPSRPFDVAR